MFENKTIEELKRDAYELNYRLEIMINDGKAMQDRFSRKWLPHHDSLVAYKQYIIDKIIEEINLREDPGTYWLSELTRNQICSKWAGEQK